MYSSGVTHARVFAVVVLTTVACLGLEGAGARAQEGRPVTVPVAAFDPVATPGRQPHARALVRAAHPYDPGIRQRALEQMTLEPDVVTMAPFNISESRNQILFERYVTAKRRRDAANRPGLTNGATVPGLPALGFTPYEDVAPAFGPALARWNLVRLRW